MMGLPTLHPDDTMFDRLACTLLITFAVAACGGGSNGKSAEAGSTPPGGGPPAIVLRPAPLPDNRAKTPMSVLWFGNSHTYGHNLPEVVRQLLSVGAGIDAQMHIAPGSTYLDERWSNADDVRLLQSQQWSALVLQAQKYSTTGQYTYPTTETENWISLAKMQQTMPVLYPEHPRDGNLEEGLRVFQLHQGIAARQSACVAPVGPVWDYVIQNEPLLRLHSNDGNHANAHGALLTAYVFYQVLSKKLAVELPDVASLPVPVTAQASLRSAASRLLAIYPACPF